MLNSPEHEYLVIKMEDKEKTSRLFILECTVNPGLSTVSTEGHPTAFEAVKQLCTVMTTSLPDLTSLEEGLKGN